MRNAILRNHLNGGQNYSILIGRAAKLTRFWLVERAVSAFSWLFEKFCSELFNARWLQILTFKPTNSVQKHGNQAIASTEFKKGEPKASHTDSRRLFVLKAKFWSGWAPLCVWRNSLIVVKFLDFLLFTTASYKSEVPQAKRKTAQIFLKHTGNIYTFYWMKGAGQKSVEEICSASSVGLVAVFMCKASQHWRR